VELIITEQWRSVAFSLSCLEVSSGFPRIHFDYFQDRFHRVASCLSPMAMSRISWGEGGEGGEGLGGH